MTVHLVLGSTGICSIVLGSVEASYTVNQTVHESERLTTVHVSVSPVEFHSAQPVTE